MVAAAVSGTAANETSHFNQRHTRRRRLSRAQTAENFFFERLLARADLLLGMAHSNLLLLTQPPHLLSSTTRTMSSNANFWCCRMFQGERPLGRRQGAREMNHQIRTANDKKAGERRGKVTFQSI